MNQKLEEDQFQTVAIPFYVLYDSDQKVLATFPELTRDPQKYLAFLNTSQTAAPANAPALAGAPFKSLEGAPLSPADWNGKVVVLNYWATYCVPCRKEIPEFNRIQAEMGANGVEVVGVSMDEAGAEVVKPYLAQNPIKYTVAIGTGTMDALPVTIVFDRKGKTVQRFDGEATPEQIRSAIAKAQTAG
jgi:thiol-disulfide isomerase/thioredoxin